VTQDETAKPDLWRNFYGRLKEIKDYHKSYTPTQAMIDYKSPRLIAERCFYPPRQERK
jgi:hypothetical protein